jgi:hypothetical protein
LEKSGEFEFAKSINSKTVEDIQTFLDASIIGERFRSLIFRQLRRVNGEDAGKRGDL